MRGRVGFQGAVHEEDGVLGESLAGLECEQGAEVVDDSAGRGPRDAEQRSEPGTCSAGWTGQGCNQISRMLKDLAGNLIATSGTVLQLANIHGDLGAQIPLVDATTPVVDTYDEYGNLLPGTDPARYGWLGGKQRSAETPSRVTLVDVRLYDPTADRFLSIDSIYGGNENSYVYFSGSGQ